jgi:hypothetical protein
VASNAAPAPVAPPPTTNTSNTALFSLDEINVDNCSSREGRTVFLLGMDEDVASTLSDSSDFHSNKKPVVMAAEDAAARRALRLM